MIVGHLVALILGLGPNKAPAEPPIPPTLTEQIDTLAAKYEVSAALATRIIECESRDLPNALRANKNAEGIIWSYDYSYWQINSHYWQKQMMSLGFDITNPQQNLEAGFYILKHYGKEQWSWSEKCWRD
jgi:hypothetical protein